MTDQPSEVDENIVKFDLVHNLLCPTQKVLSSHTQSLSSLHTVVVLGHDVTTSHTLHDKNTRSMKYRSKAGDYINHTYASSSRRNSVSTENTLT